MGEKSLELRRKLKEERNAEQDRKDAQEERAKKKQGG